MHWDDMLGDELKRIEAVEAGRAAAPGEFVVVRVDGASFSRFTSALEKPFDERFSRAMVEATRCVVADFKARIGYTQSDESTIVLWEPNGDLPYGGRLQKLATRVAAKMTAAFLLQALRLFPDAVERQVPEFDGRAYATDDRLVAAKSVLWREIDGRRNAVNAAASAHFSHGALQGRSTQERKAMLAASGVDLSAWPEAFRRGVFLRRVTEPRMLTPEEMERIPPDRRPTGPVMRSRVGEVDIPPLSSIGNLADVVIEGAIPVLPTTRGFEASIHP